MIFPRISFYALTELQKYFLRNFNQRKIIIAAGGVKQVAPVDVSQSRVLITMQFNCTFEIVAGGFEMSRGRNLGCYPFDILIFPSLLVRIINSKVVRNFVI